MFTVNELVRCINDPDDDSTRAYEIVDEMVASGDKALVPHLATELQKFLNEGDFYGRDVIADALAGLAGIEALPLLIAASARDLGDDQDTLQSTILELISVDEARARALLENLSADDSPSVRETAAWALEFLEPDLD
ncbi:HEAT repeat domain-containing protein [Thermomonospora cellulosilytica]|uniref:HEAT repeat protein n=1 Tax=Thermomonospora cellulosilytica TaxID=1411118 RepID=A0A7W3MZ25_9ACTN|nr:hypothetical protein [Thermomonospora cellulosilytica]MBA9004505.1 HEAT repeat protein [Thermomonospora cellulosilytica]